MLYLHHFPFIASAPNGPWRRPFPRQRWRLGASSKLKSFWFCTDTHVFAFFASPLFSPKYILQKNRERERERGRCVCVYVCSQFTGNRKYRISDQIMSHPQNKLDKQSLIYLLQPNWPGFGPSCCRTRSKENSWRRVIFGSPSIIETSSPFCYCRRSWPLKLTAMRWRERWLVEISKPLFEAAVEHQKTWVWFQENVDLCVNSGDFTKTNGGPQHARPAKNRLSLVWQYLALEW